jgi:hypothetical protein
MASPQKTMRASAAMRHDLAVSKSITLVFGPVRGATPASGYPDPGADSAIGLPCAGANMRNGLEPVQNPSW